MAYKKFIKRGDNVYGPYVYKSRKENGKVITEYLGKPKDKSTNKIKTKKIPLVLSIIGLIAVLSLIIFLESSLTGKVALQIQKNYLSGEQIQGNLELSLKQGELIPAGTKIFIDNSGEISEYVLSDLISENIADTLKSTSGKFYAEGTSVSGEGQGYGIVGEKKIYPDVYFTLQIVGKGIEKPETEIEETEKPTEEIPEQPVETENPPAEVEEPKETTTSVTETPVEKDKDKKEEKSKEEKSSSNIFSNADAVPEETSSVSESSETENSGESNAGITGEVIKENSVEGIVSKDAPFIYELPDKKSVKVKPNSVRTETKDLPENEINLKVSDAVAEVTTDYYEIENGFGEDYLINEKINFNIDLSQFGLTAKEGQLIIKLVYESEEISSVSKSITVDTLKGTSGEEMEINETEIPEENATEIPENITEISNETIPEIPVANITEILNETIVEQNITEQNITEIPTINVSVIENLSSLQYKAIAGRPVKWIKIIKTTNETDLVELPKKSSNITIKTGEEVQQALNEMEEYENTVDNADRNEMADGTLTGMVALDLNENKGFLQRLIDWFSKLGLTGNAISEGEMGSSITETDTNKIVDIDGVVINATDGTDVAVEYYTEPSVVVEENLTNGKRITISADDAFNYTDILAYSLIDKQILMQNAGQIKLYWDNNGTTPLGVPPSTEYRGKTKTNFTPYDLDSDGDIDYVEWIVPHLSVQVYELIYIVKAEHLDANRTFISDIYDDVSAQDGIWSEPINDSEYVRVTFEQLLDNTKDITIYARSSCSSGEGFVNIDGVDVPCDIYLKKKRIDEIRGLLG